MSHLPPPAPDPEPLWIHEPPKHPSARFVFGFFILLGILLVLYSNYH